MKAIRIFLFVLIIIGIILLCTQSVWVPKLVNKILLLEGFSIQANSDYKNIIYTIDGRSVTLVNGLEQVPVASGSASKIVTRYFGNDAIGDLNGDGLPDVGFILTQNSGGSGTFYYAVVALKTSNGYQGTNAVLLGDRVAPQTTEIRNRQLIVNYAERSINEPMTVRPSLAVSKYLVVHGTTLETSQPVTN